MSSSISPNPLRTSYPLCCHSHKSPHAVPSLPPRNVSDSNSDMPCRFAYSFTLCSSRNLRMHRVKRACFSHFDDFHHEEEEDGNTKEIAYAVSSRGSSDKEQFWTVKPDFLEPSVLGIHPEPPSWPERDEILRLRFERKVNSVELPLSIRMIKKKLQWHKSFKEATTELTYYHCSVKKTFSSMLFIIHQLQSYALQTRESVFCEGLQGVMQRELDVSFVWLFQEVFSKTPNFMVYMMVLIANFSLFSISNNTSMAVSKNKQGHSQEEYRKELTEEEEKLWNLILDEASRWQKELGTEVLDHETMLRFVSPMSVQLEGDHQYEEYVKTRIYYIRHLHQAPFNSLLLSNYAQFLYLVIHDLDGAEEYFKRSVMVEPPDAEAFSRYADFLWLVRNDLWAAELRYQQALEADPSNNYYASKYANFLWSTGGTDTCFPLESSDNLQL